MLQLILCVMHIVLGRKVKPPFCSYLIAEIITDMRGQKEHSTYLFGKFP